MEWVSGEGVLTFEFPNSDGAPIWVRDYFGSGSPSPRTSPPSKPAVA